MSDFGALDAKGLARLYTEAKRVLLPTGDTVTNDAQLSSFRRGVTDKDLNSAKLEIEEVEPCEDTVTELRHSTLRGAVRSVLAEVEDTVKGQRGDELFSFNPFILAPSQALMADQERNRVATERKTLWLRT